MSFVANILESFEHNVNLPGLFIVLGVVIGVGALGIWGVHRTSGRPIREMLALLTAAFLIIAFMVPLVLCLDEWLKSPDLAIRELTKLVFTVIILPIAYVIWRFFNKLSKPKQKLDPDGQGRRHHHEPIA